MKRLTVSEIIFYFFFYGLIPLSLAYIVGLGSLLLVSPLLIVKEVFTYLLKFTTNDSFMMDTIMVIIYILCYSGIFSVYYLSTREALESYGKPNLVLLGIFIALSAILNYFITYFICAISMLSRCDPAMQLSIGNIWKHYIPYAIIIIAFVSAYRLRKTNPLK